MFILGFAFTFFTGSEDYSSSMSYETEVAFNLAESALEEFVARLKNALNDSSENNQLFKVLRADNVDVSKFDYIQELTDRFSRIAEARRQSTADRIQKRAVVPHLFCQIRQPNTQYVVFPRHTSSNYSYLPLGYLTPEIIVGDACYILSDAPLYLFGVLESSIHKYWVELVAGRLGDAALRYTPAVYNNFPWVRFSDAAKERIAETAQKIIESRNNHLDQSLSHLYDPGKMPKDLEMAHYENDKAVLDAYGFSYNMTEPEIVAELMKLYQNLTKEE